VNDSHQRAHARQVDFKTDLIAGSVACICSSRFCAAVGLVLVLSIAVLVIVPVRDGTLGYGLGSLDQPSEHRHDPFQVRFSATVRFVVKGIASRQFVVDEGDCNADPRAISKNQFLSLRLCFPFPSAMFKGMG
jgi:hypothetical protein